VYVALSKDPIHVRLKLVFLIVFADKLMGGPPVATEYGADDVLPPLPIAVTTKLYWVFERSPVNVAERPDCDDGDTGALFTKKE
jgi:hypothetical protein